MRYSLSSAALAIALTAGIFFAVYQVYRSQAVPPPAPTQPARPAPKAPDKPKRPRCPNCPDGDLAKRKELPCKRDCGINCQCGNGCDCGIAQASATVKGGRVSPDGKVEIVLPTDKIDWPKNIASRGLGCCGFRALDYAARAQGVPQLIDLPEHMRADGVAGGAWPEKMGRIMSQYGSGLSYFQDTSKSVALLEAMVQSKRLPCIDYSGRDVHYNGDIAHCVNVAACSVVDDWVAILDNNFPSLDEIVWMRVDAFKARWNGWAYGLLAEAPGKVYGMGFYSNWNTPAERASKPIFGLVREGHPWGDASTLNGKSATVEQIIQAIGPAMVPKIESKVTLDMEHAAGPAAIAVAGAFVIWLLTDIGKRGQR